MASVCKKILVAFVLLVFPLAVSAVQVRKAETSEHEDDPLTHHLADSDYIEFPGIKISLPHFDPVTAFGYEFDFSITNHFVYFWIGALVLVLVLRCYKRKQVVQTSLMGQMVESIVLFVRDDIVKPAMPHDYQRFMPLMLTFFFFILVQNVMGLTPFLSQCTKNLSATAALAFVVFIVWQYSALKRHGLIGYIRTMLPIRKGEMALPAVITMNLFLFPMEFIQIFTKTGTLAIRLFANMIAGHAVILTFLLMGWGGAEVGWNFLISIPGVAASVGIYVLECLIAFLQAYVFTLLSAMFIGASLEDSH